MVHQIEWMRLHCCTLASFRCLVLKTLRARNFQASKLVEPDIRSIAVVAVAVMFQGAEFQHWDEFPPRDSSHYLAHTHTVLSKRCTLSSNTAVSQNKQGDMP